MSPSTRGTVSPSVNELTHDLYTLGYLDHYDVQAEYNDRVAAAVSRFQADYMRITPTGQCERGDHMSKWRRI